jgi:cell volume regulation protein A
VPLALVVEDQILIAGAILALAVVAAVATRRLRLPLLVTFLGLGMLLGSEGIGGIYFDDAQLARSIGVVGLLAILFAIRRARVPKRSRSYGSVLRLRFPANPR